MKLIVLLSMWSFEIWALALSWFFGILLLVSMIVIIFNYFEIVSLKKLISEKIARISKNPIMREFLIDDLNFFGWKEEISFYEIFHPLDTPSWLRKINYYLIQVETEIVELKQCNTNNIDLRAINAKSIVNIRIEHIEAKHLVECDYQKNIINESKKVSEQIKLLVDKAHVQDLNELHTVALYRKVQLTNFHLLRQKLPRT